VAGKTGTAELRSTVAPEPVPGTDGQGVAPAPEYDPRNTDAWFSSYAPAGDPRVAVGVLLVESGAGGETAAPAARAVLEAALRRRG
jgi:cell division protein FtsI/penicillin-binding protein 2